MPRTKGKPGRSYLGSMRSRPARFVIWRTTAGASTLLEHLLARRNALRCPRPLLSPLAARKLFNPSCMSCSAWGAQKRLETLLAGEALALIDRPAIT